MLKLKRFFVASLLMGFSTWITACQGLPLGPMMKLGNPLDLDPAEVKFAIRGPEVLHLRDQDLKLKISYEHPSLSQAQEHQYSFQRETKAAIPGSIQADLQAGEKAEIYSFSAETIAALRQLKQEMEKHKAAGNAGKGTISVSLSNGCKTGPLPAGPLYVGIYTQTHQQEGFFELMPKVDLRKLLEANGVKSEAIPDCQV